MKKSVIARNVLIAGTALLFIFSDIASAYWVWTPGTKKFINPKYAVKDSPKEQFEWAMSFYSAKDYQRASTEFEKLTKQYEYSEYASKAQYYVGLCYESMNKPYIAFQNYQKAIDNFPHIENMDEIVAREYNIANMFAVKESPKVLGTDIMTSLDRAIEIYKKVVENAPYGRLADEAQFKMGLTMKQAGRYDEAIQAFQKILDDYPTSSLVDKAKFEVADSANKASLKPAYDAEPTSRAIRAFEDFSRENRDRSLTQEAEKTIQRLRDRAAEKSLLTAQFYEKIGRYQAAVIYYKDIIEAYPDSSFVPMARSKVESLTAKLERPKKPFMAMNFTKPSASPKAAPQGIETPEPVEAQKKGWRPLNFTGTPKQKEAVAETPADLQAAKKKGWTPFSFTKPAKSKESVTTEKLPEVDASRRGEWNPLDLFRPSRRPAKPKEAVVEPAPEPQAVKKSWTPLNFDKPEKGEKAVTEVSPEPQGAKKSWAPLNFTKASKPKPAVEEAAAPGEKSWRWRPFDFTRTRRPVSMAAVPAEKESAAPPAAVQSEEPASAPSSKAEPVTPEEPKKVEEPPVSTAGPAAATEESSQITVTTNEAEVKTPESRAVESGYMKKESAQEPAAKEEDTEDQIEKTEY
ncbi:MAG: outer membrane protein assembly factor BamD [Candidatus Omnitrophota bacterium]